MKTPSIYDKMIELEEVLIKQHFENQISNLQIDYKNGNYISFNIICCFCLFPIPITLKVEKTEKIFKCSNSFENHKIKIIITSLNDLVILPIYNQVELQNFYNIKTNCPEKYELLLKSLYPNKSIYF